MIKLAVKFYAGKGGRVEVDFQAINGRIGFQEITVPSKAASGKISSKHNFLGNPSR